MEIDEILEALTHDDGQFPRQALEAAIERREEITPRLLDILAELAVDPLGYLEENPENLTDVYTMFLLAQFRERRAYPLVVRFFSQPGPKILDATGDFVTEELSRILSSVYDGDLKLLREMIENQDLDEYLRGAGLKTITSLVLWEDLDRGEALAYYRYLFSKGLEKEYNHAWSALVSACCDLAFGELQPQIGAAFEKGYLDPFFMSKKDVADDFAMNPEKLLARSRGNKALCKVDDAMADLKWWSSLREREEPKVKVPEAWEVGRAVAPGEGPKVGRNDPCPCGSGKKWKKCCGSPSRRTG